MSPLNALLFLVVHLVGSLHVLYGSTWEALPALPEPAAGFVAGSVSGKILVAGGTNWHADAKRWLNTVWSFDTDALQWTHGPALPHAVAYAAFASDGKHLFFAGGADGQQGRKGIYALNDRLQVTHLGDLPQAVVYGAGALRNGQLHISGGTPDPEDWNQGSNQIYAVSLTSGRTDTLAPLSLLTNPIGLPAVTAIGDQLFTFTGAWMDDQRNARNVAGAFRHERKSNRWHAIAAYPEALRGVSSVRIDEHRVYLAGGYSSASSQFVAQAWIYDRRTNGYARAVALPLAVNTTLVRGGEFIYLLGGEDQMRHRSAACWRIRLTDLAGEP